MTKRFRQGWDFSQAENSGSQGLVVSRHGMACLCGEMVQPHCDECVLCSMCSRRFHMACVTFNNEQTANVFYHIAHSAPSTMSGSFKWLCAQCSLSIDQLQYAKPSYALDPPEKATWLSLSFDKQFLSV